MTTLLPFQALSLIDRGTKLTPSIDEQTKVALENQRDQILMLTNYIEALYAQLLAAEHGHTAVSAVGSGT